jgi:hypothetical protein
VGEARGGRIGLTSGDQSAGWLQVSDSVDPCHMRQLSLASSGNTENRLREAHDVIIYSTMSPSRFSKPWHLRRHRRKRGDERGTPHTPTIGNGKLPIKTLQQISPIWICGLCCVAITFAACGTNAYLDTRRPCAWQCIYLYLSTTLRSAKR